MRLTSEECTQNHRKNVLDTVDLKPLRCCMLFKKESRREEFSSVHVSGEKNRRSAGEGVLGLVQYNLSLMELISLDSGPHKPSHTASRQPQAQARQDCFHSRYTTQADAQSNRLV